MGKKDKYRKYKLEKSKIPRDIPEYFEQLLEEIVNYPSDFIVPPLNPQGFGTQRPELLYKSPLLTGQILFDDTFYNVLPPPPLGAADPTYTAWENMVNYAQRRSEICQPGKESPKCTQARNDYFDAARAYATALDRTWGLHRFGPGGEVKDETNGKRARGAHTTSPSQRAPNKKTRT